MADTILEIVVDDKLKDKAEKVFQDQGLDISTAIRMFLKRSVLENRIPFDMTTPKQAYHSSKALDLLKECNRQAQESGAAKMTLEEINAEIVASRREREVREKAGK